VRVNKNPAAAVPTACAFNRMYVVLYIPTGVDTTADKGTQYTRAV